MSEAKIESTKKDNQKPHAAFFKQSGWMMIAGVASGALMYLVHPIVARELPKGEYGVFTTLLQVISLMGIPAVGLQPVIAQQAAAAITDEQQLAGVVASEFRGIFRGIFYIWLAMVALVAIFWQQALAGLKIENSMALGIALGVGLVAMWAADVLGRAARTAKFFLARLVANIKRRRAFQRGGLPGAGISRLGWASVGMVVGVLLGLVVAVGCSIWQARGLWRLPSTRIRMAQLAAGACCSADAGLGRAPCSCSRRTQCS